MGRRVDWKRVLAKLRKPWVMTIGGLLIGALGAGVFVILINYVIQPQMSVETRDISAVEGDRFDIWYHDGSPHRAGYEELNARLEASLDELLVRLDVDPSNLAFPIDVLVHDDARQLQSSIVQRKSSTSTHTFFAVLDLLGGEDPYPRLVEVVLAFGWGECFSQLLYDATLTVLIDPEVNLHSALAAAPPRLRYSFEDLVELEAAGQFQPTLYQRFDSPFSSSQVFGSLDSLAAFYAVFSSGGQLTSHKDFASLQAASLVAYLIECNGGLEAVRSVWGPGSSVALFGRLACGPLDELSESWWAVAGEEGKTGEEYDYYRAAYLFEAGDFDEAYRLARAWEGTSPNPECIALAVRSALSVGAFAEARAWAEGVGSSQDQLAQWVSLFDDWERIDEGGITVFGGGSTAELGKVLAAARAGRARIVEGLSLTEKQVPPRMTLFVYADEAARQAGQGVTPAAGANQTAWHVVSGEDVEWALATTLPSYAYRTATASSLLRVGLAAALTIESAELVERGCETLDAGNWTPLWQLGFGGVPSQLLRTESGLMIRYVLDTHGCALIEELWRATARLGGGMSLDSALLEFAETSRRDIERTLLDSVLVCD